MPRNGTTADWLARQLRNMDWCLRHKHMACLQAKRPALFNGVCRLLAADECLYGQASPIVVAFDCTLILKDAPSMRKPGKVQTTLFRYFPVKKKPMKIQTTMLKYFNCSNTNS